MIPNVVRGNGFRGLLDYALGPKHGDGTERRVPPTLLGGNMGEVSVRGLATEFGEVRSLNHASKNPVWHVSLSAHPDEHLTEAQWLELSEAFITKVGQQAQATELGIDPDRHQYVVIRHQDKDHDHVHLILNRIAYDGKVAYCKWDKNRAQQACRELEQELGLMPVVGKSAADKEQERALAKAAKAAKAAGLPVPEVGRQQPRPLSRRDLARLARQKAAAGSADSQGQVDDDAEQQRLSTALPQSDVLDKASVEAVPLQALSQSLSSDPLSISPPSVIQPEAESSEDATSVPLSAPIELDYLFTDRSEPALIEPHLSQPVTANVPAGEDEQSDLAAFTLRQQGEAQQRQVWGREMATVAEAALQYAKQTSYETQHYRFVQDGDTLTIEATDSRGILVKLNRHELWVSDQIRETDRDSFRSTGQKLTALQQQPSTKVHLPSTKDKKAGLDRGG